MKKKFSILILIIISITACKPSPNVIQSFVKQTVEGFTPQATFTKFPTYTAYPTQTEYPTQTPYPTLTSVKITVIVTETKTATPIHTPSDTLTPTITATITNTATLTPTEDFLKSNKMPGFYLVGVDIAPGIWRSQGNSESCYWEITTRTGNIIDNHFGMAGGTINIPYNAFQVELDTDCGYWVYLDN